MVRENPKLTERFNKILKETSRIFVLIISIIAIISSSVIAPIKLEPIFISENLTQNKTEPIKLIPESTPELISNLSGVENLTKIKIEDIIDLTLSHPKLILEDEISQLNIRVKPENIFEEIKTKIDLNSANYNIIINEIKENKTYEVMNNRIENISNDYKFIKNISINATKIIIKVIPYIEEINNKTYYNNITIDRIKKNNLKEKAIKEWKLNLTFIDNKIDAQINNTKIIIENLKDIDKLKTVKIIEDNNTKQISYENKLKTSIQPKSKILAANLGNTTAQILLEKIDKNSSAENIYTCNDWSYLKEECNENWKITNISFIDNSTHILFNVTHFSAYMAGASASLWVWDETDTNGWFNTGHTRFVNENIIFYANYTRDNGNKIPTGQGNCYIKFNESGIWSEYEIMPTYDGASGIRSYIRNFTDSGTYNYNITCNGTFSEIELQDDVNVNFAGTKLNQYKDIIYDTNNDVFNITITITNKAIFEEIVHVYDILDLNMNATGFNIIPLNNGTYLGTRINGKYFEWNVTIPSLSSLEIRYIATPVNENAKTKNTQGLG